MGRTYRKFNNDNVRDKSIKEICRYKGIDKFNGSIKLEKEIYNNSIKESKENGIMDIPAFKRIYLKNIEKLCAELDKHKLLRTYFNNNHSINENELNELLTTTNIDYSNTPLPILSQPSFISDEVINIIRCYNEKNGTNYGFRISDIFALEEKPKKKKGDCKYLSKFQLEKSEDGKEMLINILKMIEDSNDSMNNNTLMKIAENIQHKYGSRRSNVEHPLLIHHQFQL